MKKVVIVLFILSLLVPGFVFTRASADEANPEAAALAQQFSQKVMDDLQSSEHPQIDYGAINPQVDDYAQKFAGILLKAGLDSKTTAMVMQEASVWYGQTLVELFNANPFNSVIQDYSDKIAGLFSRYNLTMDTQSKIIDMTSDNLESLNNLFNPMEEVQD